LHKCTLLSGKHPELLKKIINDYDINSQTNNRWTALILATRYSNKCSTEGTVKMLIESKANLDLQNKNGLTALMIASIYSNTESTVDTVKMLIESKANLDLQNKDGQTAIMLANIDSNYKTTKKIVKMLIETNANLNLQDMNSKTVFMYVNKYMKDFILNNINIELLNDNFLNNNALAKKYIIIIKKGFK